MPEASSKSAELAAKFNKDLGDGTIILASDIHPEFAPRVTSGSLSLDVALGGGWPTNRWIEIIGEASAGKTAVAWKTIAANQELDPNWTAAWVAAEPINTQYAQMLGCDLSRIVVIDTNIMEEAYDAALAYMSSQEVDALIIDSLPALTPDPESKGDMDDNRPGLGARLTNKFFRKAGKAIKRSTVEQQRPVLPIMINQYRDMIGVMYGDPRTTPGGKGKNYEFFIRVELMKGDWIEDDHKRRVTNPRKKDKRTSKPAQVGQEIRARVMKNKSAPGQRIAEMDFFFDDAEVDGVKYRAGEYDLVRDAISAGRANRVVSHRGGGYYVITGLADQEWRGLGVLEDALREDSSLIEHIRDEVISSLTRKESVNTETAAQVIEEPAKAPRRRARKAQS